MTLNLLPLFSLGLLFPYYFFLLDSAAAAAESQNGQTGYAAGAHVPILYEAYYPEQRNWSPQASLREIQRLRELTGQLLREEEQLGRLAAAAAQAAPENVLEPRGQLLQYVFSGTRPEEVRPARREPDDRLQVASLTISDVGPQQQQQQHKLRHRHGQANWLLRRLAAPAGPFSPQTPAFSPIA